MQAAALQARNGDLEKQVEALKTSAGEAAAAAEPAPDLDLDDGWGDLDLGEAGTGAAPATEDAAPEGGEAAAAEARLAELEARVGDLKEALEDANAAAADRQVRLGEVEARAEAAEEELLSLRKAAQEGAAAGGAPAGAKAEGWDDLEFGDNDKAPFFAGDASGREPEDVAAASAQVGPLRAELAAAGARLVHLEETLEAERAVNSAGVVTTLRSEVAILFYPILYDTILYYTLLYYTTLYYSGPRWRRSPRAWRGSAGSASRRRPASRSSPGRRRRTCTIVYYNILYYTIIDFRLCLPAFCLGLLQADLIEGAIVCFESARRGRVFMAPPPRAPEDDAYSTIGLAASGGYSTKSQA